MESLDKGKQVLVMTIDLGDNRQDFITVCEHDSASDLAEKFSSKYRLNKTIQDNLTDMIKLNKDEVLKNNLHLREPSSELDSIELSPFLSPIKTENHVAETIQKIELPKTGSKLLPPKGNIYSSVYKHLKKKISSQSISLSNNKSKLKATGYNYGDYLYAKGIKDKEAAERLKIMKKQELFEQNIHQLTFSPLINTNSSQISPRHHTKIENYLIQKQEQKKARINKLKEELDKEKLKECYFTPKINKKVFKSDIIKLKKYKELYMQADKLKQKKDQMLIDQISKISFRPYVGKAKKKNVTETTEQFLERLENSKKLNEEELKQIRKEKERCEFDLVTGQKLFHPLIYDHSDKLMYRSHAEPIWEYLYSKKDEKKKGIELSQAELINHIELTSNTIKTTENSNKIYENLRIKQFQKLFRKMDSDNDGKISSNAIDISQIEIPVLQVLTPFFEELEKSDKPMDITQFLKKMKQLHKHLTVEGRAILIKKAEKQGKEERERSPYISTVSIALAEKKRSNLPEDFFERQNIVSKMSKMKLDKAREEVEKINLDGCTFKPILKISEH